jgi:RimJ/RimL family protein N-acetyltransferase
MPQPTLETDRLRLRPFTVDDARLVRELAGAREVAATTLNVPHPYEEGMAEAWIATHAPAYAADEMATFAITLAESAELIGSIGLRIGRSHARAELGYWIGVPHWGRGYATEAARAVIAFGFEELGLNRIYAQHMASNPASGRVMQKAGMRHEGTLRQHVTKFGVRDDIAIYGILASDRPD